MRVFIKSGDAEVPAFVEDQGSFVSPHTGASLKTLTVTLRTSNDDMKAVVEDIIEQQQIVHVSGTDAKAGWQPRQKSLQFSNDSPITTHTWELIEQEPLTIESIQLGDLTLTPCKYAETIEADGTMIVNARATLDSYQLQKLRALPLYFAVVRNGINKKPREMRFGRCLWSQHDGHVKHGIILVDRAYDAGRKRGGLMEPELGNIAEQLAQTQGRLDALIDFLKVKGVIDDETIQQFTRKASEANEKHHAEFTRVNDLDEWE